MSVTLYGIPNCDTMKKARSWLDAQGVDYQFHNYRVAGIDRASLVRWCRELGWENVCNRSGTTFRKLSEAERDGLTQTRAIDLMLAQPGMIKRPVLDVAGRLTLGFKAELYRAALAGQR